MPADIGRVSEVVMSAANGLLPEGELIEAEHKQGEGIELFSLEIRAGELVHELIFSRAGELDRHLLRVPATIEVPVAP
jgi:hypothetical protein